MLPNEAHSFASQGGVRNALETLCPRNASLVVEEQPIVSKILQSHGMQVSVYLARQICLSSMQLCPSQIRSGQFGLVWLEFPSSR